MKEKLPVILNTYEIIKQIGAGGGGIIYLAQHLRLQKKVVLKADKRGIKTKLTTLRREVDSLKNLNNKYIPNVYDFVEQDGIVYTVMDYIEGKSFDYYIKENIKFSQADTIKWTKQILEALQYLHSIPPYGILHADIKPANIMLTPEGDVILIDFNIALALGEEGAVAVGKSHGYASPEHYGLDYTNYSKSDYFSNISNRESSLIDIGKTVVTNIDAGETVIDEPTVTKNKKIKLDKTSDIYSLGATIYHILTGIKPATNAFEVDNIDKNKYSCEFIKIINKAMQPDSTLRYQSTTEMLDALNNIHKTDKRSKSLKRKFIGVKCFSIIFLVMGLMTTYIGLKQLENLQKSLTLAEYSSKALIDGDKESAINYALQSLNNDYGIYTPPTTAKGQKALTDALSIYDFKDDYKLDGVLNLPSAPLYLEIARNGNLAIVGYSKEFIVFKTSTNEIQHVLKTGESALYEATFLNDNTIIYTSDDGVICFDLQKGLKLWSGEKSTSVTVSEDGKVIAINYKENDYAIIYDAKTGEKIKQLSFNGKTKNNNLSDVFINTNDDIFVLNELGTKLAVSFNDGAVWIYDIYNSENDIELFDGTSEYTIFDGGFNNKYFAFSSTNGEESVFAVIDTELFLQTGGFNSTNKYTVKANSKGIYVQTENILVKINPVTGEQIPLVTTDAYFENFAIDDNATMISTKNEYILFDNYANEVTKINKDSGSSFFDIKDNVAIVGNFNENNVKNLKYYSFDNKNIFEYDTKFIHDEARISKKYNTLMLFQYDKFYLLNENGVIKSVEIDNASNVYDQQYRRLEEDYLEVKYYDGTVIKYSAKDGSIINEEKGEKPNLSLEEEFETTKYIIKSPLHGNAVIYDKKNEKIIKQLDNDGYLTYITEIGEKIIAQYITTDGFYYGIMLCEKLETIAYIPNLCDVVGEELIFDMPTGKIRSSKIYKLDELIEMANLN